MKIDFTRPLLDLSGKPVLDADANQPATLGTVVVGALLRQDTREQSESDRCRGYSLMQRIHNCLNGADPALDLPAEDIAFLKTAVGKVGFSLLVCGRATDMLENKPHLLPPAASESAGEKSAEPSNS